VHERCSGNSEHAKSTVGAIRAALISISPPGAGRAHRAAPAWERRLARRGFPQRLGDFKAPRGNGPLATRVVAPTSRDAHKAYRRATPRGFDLNQFRLMLSGIAL
jgi:hypothetical protein